jgi:lipopolysaccharide transport system permease protein
MITFEDQPNIQTTNKPPICVLEPPKGWNAPNLREIWEYRELLFFLAWRDLKVRYKQTSLGIGWAIIPPVVNMVIFSIILGGMAKLPSEGVPYPIFSFVGLVPWGFFSRALSGAGNSLLSGAGLSAKVYFPRLVITLSAVIASLMDSAISFLVLTGLMLWFGIVPGWGTLALPFFILLVLLTALAVGVWLAALAVKYRDVAQLSGLLTTLWMYASPVIYSPTLIPDGTLKAIYWINPVAIVVQGFRWALIGSPFPPYLMMILSIPVVLLLLVSGLYYFQRVERTFIDLV